MNDCLYSNYACSYCRNPLETKNSVFVIKNLVQQIKNFEKIYFVTSLIKKKFKMKRSVTHSREFFSDKKINRENFRTFLLSHLRFFSLFLKIRENITEITNQQQKTNR